MREELPVIYRIEQGRPNFGLTAEIPAQIKNQDQGGVSENLKEDISARYYCIIYLLFE